MKIVLMRHGQPELDLNALNHLRKSPAETGQIIVKYETTDLAAKQTPPHTSLEIANSCNQVFSSDMLRTISSAQHIISYMQGDYRISTNACFRESAHPYLEWKQPKLKFFTWCILFRLGWFMGFAKNGEAISLARKRAQTSAERLQLSAVQNGDILLLGHGFMNRLIVAKLKKLGWRKTHSTGHKYWSFITMEKD